MDKGRKAIFGGLLKLFGIILIALVMSVVMLTNTDTYSWLSSMTSGSMSISAATTGNILETIELVYGNPDARMNPIALKVRKNPDFHQQPLIFFSIEGEGLEYLLHVNPLRVASDNEYIIPLKTNINLMQCIKLLGRNKQPVMAKLKVKYLDEFIDKELILEFSNVYLISKFIQDIEEEKAAEGYGGRTAAALKRDGWDQGGWILEDEVDADIYLVEMLKYIAQQTVWPETVAPAANAARTANENPEEAAQEYGEVPEFTGNQNSLLDIIFPGLREYISRLIGALNNKTRESVQKEEGLAGANERIAALEAENAQLASENAKLAEENADLNARLEVYQNAPPSFAPPAPPSSGPAAPPSGGGEEPLPVDDSGDGSEVPFPVDDSGDGSEVPPPVDDSGNGSEVPPPVDGSDSGEEETPPGDSGGGGEVVILPDDSDGGGLEEPAPVDDNGNGSEEPAPVDDNGDGSEVPPPVDNNGNGSEVPPPVAGEGQENP